MTPSLQDHHTLLIRPPYRTSTPSSQDHHTLLVGPPHRTTTSSSWDLLTGPPHPPHGTSLQDHHTLLMTPSSQDHHTLLMGPPHRTTTPSSQDHHTLSRVRPSAGSCRSCRRSTRGSRRTCSPPRCPATATSPSPRGNRPQPVSTRGPDSTPVPMQGARSSDGWDEFRGPELPTLDSCVPKKNGSL